MKIRAIYYGSAALVALLITSYAAIDSAPEPVEICSAVKAIPSALAGRSIQPADPGEEMSSGELTVPDATIRSLGRSARNLSPFDERWPFFGEGKEVFDRDWTEMNHSPLGPLFSSNSCDGCHRKDGRGRAPNDGEFPESMVVLLTNLGDGGEQLPDPDYGAQLDYQSMNDDDEGEGIVRIDYDYIEGKFADGATFTLRRPAYEFRNLAHGAFDADTRFSARVAPALCGIGLLEAIPEAAILANADPADRDRDGISGRPNRVHDIATGGTSLGRFGWKGGQPTLAQQIAKAFHDDMGISTPYYPEDRALVRPAGFSGRDVELDPNDFDRLLFYTKLLAVPQRRGWNDSAVRRGKALFAAAGCAACHAPRFVTGRMQGYPELEHQTIRPYSDLLLHDMGDGLADGRPDAEASGREWRTPPLWGIGLVKTVNKHTFFLHDGRARNLEEAVLWHGGEAIAAQRFYRGLPKGDRAALIAFLESL